jgi:uncharacterized protein YukE
MAKATTKARRGDADQGEEFDIPDEALKDEDDLPSDTVLVGDNADRGVALKISPNGMDDDDDFDLPPEQRNRRQPARREDRREAESERRDEQRETRQEADPYEDGDRGDRREAEYDEEDHRLSRRQRRNRNNRDRSRQSETMIAELRKTVGGLQETINRLSGGQYQLTAANVDTQMRSTQQALELCDSGLAKAIADQDGEEFARIQKLRDKAVTKMTQLQGAKQRLEEFAARRVEEEKKGGGRVDPDREQETPQLSPVAQRKIGMFMQRHPWFNPAGNDWLSSTVRRLDAELLEEGEDPEDSDYWNELETRMREEGIDRNGIMREEDRENERSRSRDRREDEDDAPPQRRRPPTRGGRGGGGGGRPGFQLDDNMIDLLRQEGLLGNNLSDEDQKRRGRLIDKWRTGMDKLRRAPAR